MITNSQSMLCMLFYKKDYNITSLDLDCIINNNFGLHITKKMFKNVYLFIIFVVMLFVFLPPHSYYRHPMLECKHREANRQS